MKSKWGTAMQVSMAAHMIRAERSDEGPIRSLPRPRATLGDWCMGLLCTAAIACVVMVIAWWIVSAP